VGDRCVCKVGPRAPLGDGPLKVGLIVRPLVLQEGSAPVQTPHRVVALAAQKHFVRLQVVFLAKVGRDAEQMIQRWIRQLNGAKLDLPER